MMPLTGTARTGQDRRTIPLPTQHPKASSHCVVPVSEAMRARWFRLEVLPQELHRGEGGLPDDVLGGGDPFVASG